jgi:hypothetical protein
MAPSSTTRGFCEGVSGPTHDQQPVFEWTEAYSGTPHYGQPKRFAFGWTMLFG